MQMALWQADRDQCSGGVVAVLDLKIRSARSSDVFENVDMASGRHAGENARKHQTRRPQQDARRPRLRRRAARFGLISHSHARPQASNPFPTASHVRLAPALALPPPRPRPSAVSPSLRRACARTEKTKISSSRFDSYTMRARAAY